MDAIRALLIGALPVALFTFVCFQWLVASGRIVRFSNRGDLERQLKSQAKAAKEARKQKSFQDRLLSHEHTAVDFFHSKLLSFGGGFYGTMALLTYVIIEAAEVWQFLGGLADPATWIEKLAPQLVIDFIINSILNLVAAFLWFATLPDMIRMENSLLWLGAAYGGYLAGLRVVGRWGDQLWAQAGEFLRGLRSR